MLRHADLPFDHRVPYVVREARQSSNLRSPGELEGGTAATPDVAHIFDEKVAALDETDRVAVDLVKDGAMVNHLGGAPLVAHINLHQTVLGGADLLVLLVLETAKEGAQREGHLGLAAECLEEPGRDVVEARQVHDREDDGNGGRLVILEQNWAPLHDFDRVCIVVRGSGPSGGRAGSVASAHGRRSSCSVVAGGAGGRTIDSASCSGGGGDGSTSGCSKECVQVGGVGGRGHLRGGESRSGCRCGCRGGSDASLLLLSFRLVLGKYFEHADQRADTDVVVGKSSELRRTVGGAELDAAGSHEIGEGGDGSHGVRDSSRMGGEEGRRALTRCVGGGMVTTMMSSSVVG